jgi:beta-mannosidase
LTEPAPRAPAGPRVEGHEELALLDGWEAARCSPGSHPDPGALDELEWLPARVPGTAAAALLDAGRWRPGEEIDLDAEDWWFRTSFQAGSAEAGEQLVLELDGIATVCEVFLNGVLVLRGDSMFATHALDVTTALRESNVLAIRCLALAPLLAERRKPRARWRTRLVEGNLRFFRTMLLGRAPGFAPSPAAVGPWRPVRLTRRRSLLVDELRLGARLESEQADAAGLLAVDVRLRSLDGGQIEAVRLELDGPSGSHGAELELEREAPAGSHDAASHDAASHDAASHDAASHDAASHDAASHDAAPEIARTAGASRATGMLRIPAVARWWPHTHGEPALHDVRLQVVSSSGTTTVRARRVGFRSLTAGERPDHEIELDGLDLHINGVRVFARGAVWTPPDPVGLAPSEARLRGALELVRDAGMNMLRIPGTSAYETEAFHDLCDELGVLVWQDFMFANLDYPIADEGFRATVRAEAELVLAQAAGRPSLAVLCGNSEVEQQVAMLGLDPKLGRGELFGELLPALIREARTDAIYVPSAPCGGALPFRPDRGVSNYYGVGGYRRGLEDARRAEVRFAAECLAFSNVPDEEGVAAVMEGIAGEAVAHHPRWKAGVPRDAGSGWDFEDVRDHYLAAEFGVEARELRRFDHDRYLELSRAVSGELMADVFGEWRRSASPCGGGLVLWLSDLAPGAGWGVIDASGKPKPAYHHLRRALAPQTVWMTDEGLGGMRVHVANDRGAPLAARLRVALYRDGEQRVGGAEEDLALAPHSCCERDFEAMLGHFADVSWAYRFGPPAHDVLVASLERGEPEHPELLAQAFRFPAGRPLRRRSQDELGLTATLSPLEQGRAKLILRSRRVAYEVRIHIPGVSASDDALTLEPGVERELTLEARGPGEGALSGSLTALNLRGSVRVASGQEAPAPS